MDLCHLLKFCFYWLATIAGTGNVPIGFDGDILDALAGETFVVKTWADTRHLKSITVVKGNVVQLTAFFMESNIQTVQYQHGVILPQYNNATREMSLVLTNCSKKHEDIYSVNETVDDTSRNNFEREVGIWNFKLNVIEPSEVKHCDVGGIFKMEIREWSTLRYLYYYDQIVVRDLMICTVATDSHLHGLRCGVDSNRYVIIIQNVTQRYIGLYTVANTIESRHNDSTRYYLNVTDQITNVIIGENVTIDWFYSQQAINRTLWVIHSSNGTMMNLSPNNTPQIGTAFRNRLVYSGNVSRCYMSFTLINIGKSDSGVFKIETICGTTVSGSKHILVEGGPLTADEVTESTPALTECTTTDSSSTGGPSLVHSAEILDSEDYTTSLSSIVQQTFPANQLFISMPIYVVIPVAIITLAMVAYVIWIHHKRLSTLEPERPHSLEEYDHELYITPIGEDNHLPITQMNDGRASDLTTVQFDSRMLILHTNQNLCMDGYEMVDISSIVAGERLCNSDTTVYEPTETINKPVNDNFGYLTVVC